MIKEENLYWIDQEIRTWENECQSKHPIKEALYAARKVLEQEPIFSRILEKTYADFCNCDGGEGWLKIDGKEYVTDVGYAIEGVEIFMEILKRRLAESEVEDGNDD